MAYNTIEKKRLEEYQKNLKLVGTDKSSIDAPNVYTPTIRNTNSFRNNMLGINSTTVSDNDKWFKKSEAMNDDNKLRGTAKTIASTGYDITGNLLRGVGSIAEGVSDLAKYGYADVQSILGNKKKAKSIRKEASEVNNFENFLGYDEEVNKSSVLGSKSNEALHGVGYYGGMIALESLGIPWQATAGITTYGSSMSEATSEGANRKEAIIYSIGSAIAEVGSEYLFSGIKLPGTGKTTEKLIELGTSKIKNKILKNITDFGISIAGEGLEEIASGVASNAMKYLTYMKDEDKTALQNVKSGTSDYFKTSAWNDFIQGVVASAITGGAQNINNLVNSRNITENAKSNTLSINDLVEEEKGNNIDTNTINTSDNTQIANIVAEIEELNSLKEQNKITKSQERQLQLLQNELQKLQNENLRNNYNNIVDNTNSNNIPTVADIVSQEQNTASSSNGLTQNSTNILPVSNNAQTSQNQVSLPTIDDSTSASAINNPIYSDNSASIPKIKEPVLSSIKKFQLNSPTITSYDNNQIKTMLKAVDIDIPTVFDYVTKVNSDLTYETTKKLTDSQTNQIVTALSQLKSYDVTGINNINSSLNTNDIRQVQGNIPINQELLNNDSNNLVSKTLSMDSTTFHNAVQNNRLTSEQHNLVVEYFENAKGTVSRDVLLEVAKDLNIKFKDGSNVFRDEFMSKRAGNNLSPKILNINQVFKGNNLKELSNLARESATNIYVNNNEKGYSTFENIDTKTIFNIGRSGINDTFSTHKNRDIVKLNTANILDKIGEEGIYFITTSTPNDTNNIKYHHFLTPVKSYTGTGNAFAHSVIREFSNDRTVNNGFYYHRIEYLDNKKGASQGAPITNMTGIHPVESAPKTDVSTENIVNNNNITSVSETSVSSSNIPQINDSVKLPTVNNNTLDEKTATERKAISQVLREKGAKVDENGNVTLYHITTPENYNKILTKKEFIPNQSPIGGMVAENIGDRSFFTYDKNWVETWRQSEDSEVIEVKVPAEYIRQSGRNEKEIYIEGTLKQRSNGIWTTDKKPTSTFYDRIAVKEYLNNTQKLGNSSFLINQNGEKIDISKNEVIKKQIAPTVLLTDNQSASRFVEQPVSDDSIQQVDENVKSQILPTNNKVLNPNEISKLTKEDANTTPKLPKIKVETGKGESHFYGNVTKKTKMLPDNVRSLLATENDVQYYKEVTNNESLEKALNRLNEKGIAETMRWFNQDGKNADATDVAEGWILLKQYSDAKDYDSVVQVAKQLRKIGTQAGQTVQAFNILNRLTPEGMVKYAQSELSEAYEQMIKNKTKAWIDKYREDFELKPNEVAFIMDTMKEVSTMKDGYDKKVKLAEIQKMMTDKLPPQKGAGIKAWMRISMLFNPKTQVRNVMGNAVIAPVNYFSDLVSSAVDSAIYKKTGVRTTGTTNLKSYGKGFKTGLFQSYNDFKKGINTRNIEGNRFEITEGKSFNDKAKIGKALNKVDSLLSFMLDAGDRGFYEASFTNSINNQLVLNNATEVTQDMIDIATNEALQRTWQDNNNYTRLVLEARRLLNAINIKSYGLGDVLIPFAKTPANLTKAIVDYSPAGLINTINQGVNLKRSLTNGQYTPQMQHEFVQSLGKATAGTMLYVLGIALATAGITSGESDDDKDVANFMKNTLGINSYSIKIGNKSFTYDWAQPVAAPLSITANIVQKQKDGAILYENVISSLDTAGNILVEQSFLDSLNTVLSNNDGIATGIQEAILELPSRAIPTLSKQIVDLTDDTQRQTFEKDKPLETTINKMKAKIPGLSTALAPSVDTLGRDIQRYGGKNNIFNVFLNPANVNTENVSDSAKEIYRLYKSTGETNIMPRVAPYYINQDGEKIILTAKQRTEYQETSGDIVEKQISNLLKNSEYNDMSDEDKASVIKDIVNYSYQIAQKEVLGTEISKNYETAYKYSEIGDISDFYTFRNSIDDTDSDTKKASITNYLIKSNLNNKQLAYLYGNYYSSEEVLNGLVNINMPIKEFIKYNSQEFESDYYANGKAVPNSKKKKVIQYVNSLNLSVAQKALLIKMEYSSYTYYDNQIVNYVNSKDIDFLDKAYILKKAGFTSFDKQIINYVNGLNITKAEKEEQLEELGFKIRNGRVYSK